MRHFKVKEVRPNIFHFSFKDPIKMCLTLLRFQEYFESSFKQIRNKKFTLIQYIELYIKKTRPKDDFIFTYVNDWSGFNFPSNIFYNAIEDNKNDLHEYEIELLKAIDECKERAGNNFYIIGSSNCETTLKHEIAHGFWYLNKDYKKEMKDLLKSLSKEDKSKFFKILKDMKYCKEVLEDETQAYLSTGLVSELKDVVDKKMELKFKKVFNKYYIK